MTPDPDPRADRHGDVRVTAAEVLAQPTRRRIVEALASSASGMTPFELADAVGLHHNAVRRHLDTLARAGLVLSEREAPAGRPGRPSRRYRAAGTAGLAEAGHRELVRLLVELVRRTGASERDVEEFGRDEGRILAGGDAPGADVLVTLAGLGFAPDDVTDDAQRRRGEQDLRLRHCPFADAVRSEGGELVCALHRGLTLGVLDATAPDAYLAAFEIRDPIAAGCRVLLRGLPIDPATGSARG